jgi:ferredoxin
MADQNLKDPQNPSGPVMVRATKVHIDRDLCIGAATCIAIAPKTFALDSDAKCVVLSTAEEDTDEQVLDAARSCPTAAIIITDQNGQKIFPG